MPRAQLFDAQMSTPAQPGSHLSGGVVRYCGVTAAVESAGMLASATLATVAAPDASTAASVARSAPPADDARGRASARPWSSSRCTTWGSACVSSAPATAIGSRLPSLPAWRSLPFSPIASLLRGRSSARAPPADARNARTLPAPSPRAAGGIITMRLPLKGPGEGCDPRSTLRLQRKRGSTSARESVAVGAPARERLCHPPLGTTAIGAPGMRVLQALAAPHACRVYAARDCG
mmetsp:Transcript_11567/g.48584  ORF Transcript_11567/g.48584 Transcript_11567/m.48584 type:complete len:234 (+) Transcript_11567:2246-2947(+)